MTAANEYPTFNDVEPSWADASCTASVDGGALVDMSDIAAIKGSAKVTFGSRRGMSGGRKTGTTTGEGDQEGSVTFYRAGYRKLVKNMAPLARTRGNQVILSSVPFDINIQLTPPGEDEIYHFVLKGCRIAGHGVDLKEGPDADKVEVPLEITEFVEIIDGQEVVLL